MEEINAVRKRAYGEDYFNAHPEVQYPNDNDAALYADNKLSLIHIYMNIGQIAVLVGYTKPSNFSAAFKKKYGVCLLYTSRCV